MTESCAFDEGGCREIVGTNMRCVVAEAVKDAALPTFLTSQATECVRKFHATVPGYGRTPLVRLKALAERLGVREIFLKDESHRFGLNSFKGLGGIYAITQVVCKELGLDIEKLRFSDLMDPVNREKLDKMVFVTATDGNHGKGIAWAAGKLGCKAHVYMPKGSSENRAQAIRDAGLAEVSITDMSYDDAARFARKMADQNGWYLVQDTSWDGYEEVPTWIIQGYTTMADEAVHQLEEYGVKAPSHVFVQAGVGAMAGGVTGFLMNYYKENRPVVAVVEPEGMACIYESAKRGDGKPHEVVGDCNTIMAGLNCGEPCAITWPILRDFASFYIAELDVLSERGMRVLAHPMGKDGAVVSGESGAATMGALLEILENQAWADLKREMGLDENAVILLFSTEGDTDPDAYRKIVGKC